MMFYLLVAAIVVQSIVSLVAYVMMRAAKTSKNNILSCTVEFKHDMLAYRASCKIRRFFFANKDLYILKSLCIEKTYDKYYVNVQYCMISKYAKAVNFSAVLAALLADDVSESDCLA